MSYVKESTKLKREHKADYGRERIEILYQDQWIVVINKDSGLLSVPYPGSKVRTAQSVLEELLRKQGTVNAKHKPFVVHRLDRDTSGVMMFALSENAQKVIMDNWHSIVTERLYHAVAENRNERFAKGLLSDLDDSGLIDDELAQNAHNVGYVPEKGARDKNGREVKTVAARTHYRKIVQGPTHTLFELSLDTGKKNQIRAHLAAHGYPLAGDEEHRARTDHFHRLCLHARTLEFDHPFTKEHMKFEVPEPDEWEEYVVRGDKKCETPVWIKENEHKNVVARGDGKRREASGRREASWRREAGDELKLGEKKLTRKDKAHMNFIEAGKKYR